MFYVEVSPSVAVKSGDVVLLCSDGFWSPLSEEEIAEGVADEGVSKSIDQLSELAVSRERERADNTTAVAVRLGDDQDEHKSDKPVCMALE
jgi:serine/threonine protein phosphatase PrpC